MKRREEVPSLDSIFADLDHPNPNINQKACLDMKHFWPKESIARLINNLDHDNVELRRKSVKALACFETDVLREVIHLFISTKDNLLRISYLKVLVLIASKCSLTNFTEDVQKLLKSALVDESTEIVLMSISFLRQIGNESIPYLKKLCRDKNVLRAKSAVSALIEIPDSSLQQFLITIAQDSSLDDLIRDAAIQAMETNILD
ncbi:MULTISPECIES: HEAT repeat domain-containing protein [Prochlorococcus]|uniref:Possible bilin biosynthesis protein CpeZ n=2 Tax=Prochlorococcus marinus TaxID=1219 RepID=G3XCS4_PROMA|nr:MULTISPECIES: HEAT repeat domain-containing protein [Prochlorococcus]CAB52703.1 bilin biosynthesis protein [Prochlorococcus marinus]AAP99385.1 Possible bilin biosynthesis protein CpeZ [Prochlorococcus marinus subsp. marinus str. CCMP1375]KGG11344.1 Bilin biosynthesis protein CpeZ [Prochlorococcus marinus str. LG]KGG18701.1 Bilin biosynthesis protein CpeZ [Prochlorococcus marinus str. SS2]KGG22974.1 Bilin biosynthesis protein CpeZ [Prochlorococcus marinus str. SS35]